MNVPKTLLLGALAASVATGLQAQTIIHLTGSTAFRAATTVAIRNILGSQGSYTFGYVGSSINGASRQIFTGNASNGFPVIIKTSWSGSVGGLQTVSQNIGISTWLTNNSPQTGAAIASPVYDPSTVPDACMSDVFQASSPYTSPALTEQTVGVVNFMWCRNNGAPAGLTNVTPQLARALYRRGTLPLALFTGNNADESKLVYAVGRDADSGTRLTAFAESGVGTLTTVAQYAFTNANGQINGGNNGTGSPITSWGFYPPETINGIFYDTGNGGYPSGGDVAAVMFFQSPVALNGYMVAYLGYGDATNAIFHGASPLMYNGVPYPFADNVAIYEGQYTFWGYEHLDYRSNLGTVNAVAKAVCDQIAAQIKGTPATASASGLSLTSMRSSRQSDGGTITATYY